MKAVNDDNKHQHIAEARIGDLYFAGLSVEKDVAKATEWYRKSVVHGYGTAMLVIGDIYCEGEGNFELNLTRDR